MRPQGNSVWSLKLLVLQALSYCVNEALSYEKRTAGRDEQRGREESQGQDK
jgi:hypothetical protein